VILLCDTSALTFACFDRRLKQAGALLQMEVFFMSSDAPTR
jgi:hypothetical protein